MTVDALVHQIVRLHWVLYPILFLLWYVAAF